MLRRTFIQITSAAVASSSMFVRAGRHKTIVVKVHPCDNEQQLKQSEESFIYSVEVPKNTPEEMCQIIGGGVLSEAGWVQITRKNPTIAPFGKLHGKNGQGDTDEGKKLSRNYIYTVETV